MAEIIKFSIVSEYTKKGNQGPKLLSQAAEVTQLADGDVWSHKWLPLLLYRNNSDSDIQTETKKAYVYIHNFKNSQCLYNYIKFVCLYQ